MTLQDLYDKVPTAKRLGIHVVGNLVVYDDGNDIHEAWVDGQGQLVPRTVAAKKALNKLGL